MVMNMPALTAKDPFKHLMFLVFFMIISLVVEAGEKERENIMAIYARLQSAEMDFQRLRSQGQLLTTEAIDYRAFITRLRNQFHQACQDLAQTDVALLEDQVPCSNIRPKNPRPVAIDQQHERTRTEHTAILASELDAALGEFDEMLLREQERVKAATPPSASNTASPEQQSGYRAGATAEADNRVTPSATGVTGSVEATSSTTGAGESSPVPQAGTKGKQAVSGTPSDIPDGSDDDVVARQLREAAEKETDPALKQRLWEEYRKYKQGIQ
jgi:hypothetical protein